MKVGDLVKQTRDPGYPIFYFGCGVVTYVDPEEIGDKDEVEVQWTSGFTDASNHSTWSLVIINASR